MFREEERERGLQKPSFNACEGKRTGHILLPLTERGGGGKGHLEGKRRQGKKGGDSGGSSLILTEVEPYLIHTREEERTKTRKKKG